VDLGYLKISIFVYLPFVSITLSRYDGIQFDLAEIRVRSGILRNCDGKRRSWNWSGGKVATLCFEYVYLLLFLREG
jgi:hypothetical protein